MFSGLTDRQRAVLVALCQALIPPEGEDGAADALPARVERLIGRIEDPRARGQLLLILTLLANPLLNLGFGGPARRFDGMDTDAKVRFLLGMAGSSLAPRRAAFQALKRLVNVVYYAWPADGASHPAWREAGYPGPLPHRHDERNDAIALTQVASDTTLDCDVVVVGSGAGGGVVAGVLAEAGRSVVVLEKGAYRLPRDFNHVEGDALLDGFDAGGLMATESGSLPILAGSGLGGGTVINYSTSFRLADRVAAEWDRLSGLRLFTGPRLRESYERVERRLSVGTGCSEPSRRDRILEDGCRALGWQWGVIPRNAHGCPSAEECGYCGYGCRHNAKQSTAVTYLVDAARAGARIVVRCEVDRVLIERGRAAGVVARVLRDDGTTATLTVRAPVVVASCGSIHTPALLVRSGTRGQAIGAGLRLHPGTAVVARFDERVDPWVGFQQTRYSDQFADQHDGYGVKFETVAMGFGLPATALGWEGPRQHRAFIRGLGHVGIVAMLLRDRDGGRVVTGRDGRPRVHYELSAYDIGHVRGAMRGAAELLASQGAREVLSLQQPPVRALPGTAGWLDGFAAAADSRGFANGRNAFITFHQMASCAMGSDPRRSVVGETGETHAVPGLFVADASVFPTSSGVNPMLTIMAIADHVARGIAGS